MDSSISKKIKVALVLTLIISQILSVTLLGDVFDGNLFLILHFGYVAVGFLSVQVWQAMKDFALLTIPCVFLITGLMLSLAFMGGISAGEVSTAFTVPFFLWGMLMYVAAPFFVGGFLSRLVLQKTMSFSRH